MFKLTLLVALLAAGLPTAWGFALLGPLPPDPGGEPWEVRVIGHNLPGDIGGAHNLDEEYRRVTPFMFYAYDASFLGFFGLAGATNVDAAFAIMNAVTNVSSYTPALNAPNEFPAGSQTYNATAQALYLVDIKSVTLSLLMEQMGLAEPERYIWTIHDRVPGNGSPCLLTVIYLIVQRNFDILDTPLNQLQYSAYVNDILYTYAITEACSGPATLAFTIPIPVDFNASQIFSSVAGNDLQPGGFYTGLTRDDVAGLRYLMQSNNINWESTASAGGRLLITNTAAATTLTTLPLSLLFQNPMTVDPATLTTNFPGISFLSVQTNISLAVTTNFVAFYTNLPPPYTNRFGPFAASGSYTNGWQPIQFNFLSLQITTLSLGDFIAAAATNDPATLQARYPDLIISSVITNSLQVQITTNSAPYFTNQTVLPIYANNLPGGLNTGFYFTNQPGPTVINYPLTQQLLTNVDLYQFGQLSRTSSPAALLQAYPDLVIVSYYSVPTNQDIPNVVFYFTNALPGTPFGSPPRLVITTNGFTRTFYDEYHYVFANVITNHAYSSSFVTLTTISQTNWIGSPYPYGITYTNFSSYYTNVMSGDILIIPTNWCGFQVVSAYSPYPTPGVSNTLGSANFTSIIGTNGLNTNMFSQSIVFTFTNRTYNIIPGICNPKLVFAINYSTNIASIYQYTFGNVVTNHFYTNTTLRYLTTNIFSSTTGTNLSTNSVPMPAFDVTTNVNIGRFSGDIFLVPNNWCGYTYTILQSNKASTTNVFTAGGVGTAGQLFTQTTISYFTNYTFAVKPGFCEAVIAFGTNYSTNLLTTFTYVYSGIVTNHYNANTFATVITTNLAAITNGVVGTLTNLVTTNLVNVGVTGDFFVVPPQWCGVKILSNILSTTLFLTNQITATNSPSPDLGQRFTQTTYTSFASTTYKVEPQICSTITPPTTLRRGIEHVQFVRANFDSLVGQFFQPITNTYTMVVITNSQQVIEYYQRVITQPDIQLSAADLASSNPSDNVIGPGFAARGIIYDSSAIRNNLRGPGTIHGPTAFTYDKVGPVFFNGPFINTNSFVFEFDQNQFFGLPYWASLMQWASFDTSTNSIILYPNGTSIANLASLIFIQIQPTPDALNPLTGSTTSYFFQQFFVASGGQPPFTWSAPNFAIPGLYFSSQNLTISGTPTVPGTYNFTLRLTDSVNRVVDFVYTIIIQ